MKSEFGNDDTINSSWLYRAGRAYQGGHFTGFLGETASFVLITVLSLAAFFSLLSVAVQGAVEVVYWLRDGQWMNYDWYQFLGYEKAASYAATEFKGLNKVISYVLDARVTIPAGVFGAIVIMFIAN